MYSVTTFGANQSENKNIIDQRKNQDASLDNCDLQFPFLDATSSMLQIPIILAKAEFSRWLGQLLNLCTLPLESAITTT